MCIRDRLRSDLNAATVTFGNLCLLCLQMHSVTFKVEVIMTSSRLTNISLAPYLLDKSAAVGIRFRRDDDTLYHIKCVRKTRLLCSSLYTGFHSNITLWYNRRDVNHRKVEYYIHTRVSEENWTCTI